MRGTWAESVRRMLIQWMKLVVLWLVHSNILISLAATGVAVSTIILAELRLAVLPLAIVFVVTFFVYTLNRLVDRPEDEQNVPGRVGFVRRYGKVLFGLAIIGYLSAFGYVLGVGIPYAPALAIPLVVAVLYSIVGLKRLLLVKNLLVGLSWGLIVLGVGVYYDVLYSTEIIVFFGFITVMLTIAAIVFDIKDIDGDRAEGIRSVPVVVGPARTRQIGVVGSLLVGVGVVAVTLIGVVHSQFLVLAFFSGYVAGYSLFATPERSPLFYGFIIDVEHILLAGLLLALEGLY